eukprot:jgi/Phyca11/132370/e_gw1.157.4.1
MADPDTEELLSRGDDDELDSSTLSTWKFVEETLEELGIDDVEQYLLSETRLEVPQVAERLMTRMYGKHSRPLQPELPFATVNEVKKLLEVELWLCFYSISQKKFYAKENERFGPVQHGIVSLVTGLFLCSHVASRGETILRAIAKASESPDELEQASENRCSVYHNLAQHTSVQLVQRILGILADSISGESRSSAGSEIPSESALGKMKNKELQQMCRDQGLTVSGNKRELISRLLNGESDTNSTKNTIKSPAAALLSAWFLAPISSTDMKVGSKNEENIRSRVPRFLEAHSNFRVLQTKSYGLLCWYV